ncbi:MAG: hypothetical protein QF664_10710 [Dehalococcoidia bacterium]|nr:hypothetical protein [Dehalococcoidia bacterium]
MNLLREDVHIHATPEAIFGRLRDPAEGGWFAAAFAVSENGALAYDLRLPLRRERAELAVSSEEPPRLLLMERAGGSESGALSSLSWALHPEAAGEVHVTVEAAYRPQGGPLGRVLEPVLYEPLRRQAYRNALWQLKQLVEGGA